MLGSSSWNSIACRFYQGVANQGQGPAQPNRGLACSEGGDVGGLERGVVHVVSKLISWLWLNGIAALAIHCKWVEGYVSQLCDHALAADELQ